LFWATIQLEPFVVEDEALDDELAERLRGPDPELRGLGAVDAVADGDDRVQLVVVDLPPHLPVPLALNSSNFSTVPPGLNSPEA